MLISAHFADVVTDTGTLSNAGAVYMSTLGVGGWRLEQRVLSKDPSGGDEFGLGLAWCGLHACIMSICADVLCGRSEHALFAGARNNDDAGSDAGRVHAFHRV